MVVSVVIVRVESIVVEEVTSVVVFTGAPCAVGAVSVTVTVGMGQGVCDAVGAVLLEPGAAEDAGAYDIGV